jgi:hypothetical protein
MIFVFNLSLLSHKEFRFLSQTMPFSFIVCAFGLKYLKENFGQKIYVITKFVNPFLLILITYFCK